MIGLYHILRKNKKISKQLAGTMCVYASVAVWFIVGTLVGGLLALAMGHSRYTEIGVTTGLGAALVLGYILGAFKLLRYDE